MNVSTKGSRKYANAYFSILFNQNIACSVNRIAFSDDESSEEEDRPQVVQQLQLLQLETIRPLSERSLKIGLWTLVFRQCYFFFF